MKKKKGGTSVKKATNSFVKSIFMGTGIGIVVWLLLLVGASALISGFDEPEKLVTLVTFVLIAVSAFVSGIVSVKLSGLNNILPGFLSGTLMLFAVWTLSLALSHADSVMSLPLKLIIVFNFLFFALLGGLAGRPSRKIKRRVGK